MKKIKLIFLVIGWLFVIFAFAWYLLDNVYCSRIQRRCTMYDLSTIDNVQDIEFYRSLNEKCSSWGKWCLTRRVKLSFNKWLCRHQYYQHVERSKNRKYFKPDTYNPCPELYTLRELNEFLND
jgi:hypothetical protein